MIRKPDADWGRESAAVALLGSAREAARNGATLASRGGHAVGGLVCWLLAFIWGLSALGGGLFGGSLPTLIGMGAMSAGAAWMGARAFKRARGETLPSLFSTR